MKRNTSWKSTENINNRKLYLYLRMKNLFESVTRAEVLTRLERINTQSRRQWGKMTVEQMLWHVNSTMSYALNEFQVPIRGNWFQRVIARRYALSELPTPKGKTRTIPEFKATGIYNMEGEKKRFKNYINLYSKSQERLIWPPNPLFGEFTGDNWARLNYKHIDHHFKQFGV